MLKSMRRITLVLIVTVAILSCDKKKETTSEGTSTLAYETKTFRLESAGGCSADTLLCASYEVQYPVFNALPAAVADSLKKQMDAALDTGNPELASSPFEVDGKAFIEDFENFNKEFPDGSMGWYYRGDVVPTVTVDTLISLTATNEYFTGGAHGGYGTYFINVDPRTGKSFTLNDFFKPGYKDKLAALGEKIFRATLDIPDTTSLADAGYEFPDNHFYLNDTYGFTEAGILFVFNVYEIAPYSLGSQEVLVPYDKVSTLRK